MASTRLNVIGEMLADPTRTEVLCALLDGRAHTGGELARHVGVAPSTDQVARSIRVTDRGRDELFNFFQLGAPTRRHDPSFGVEDALLPQAGRAGR